MHIVIGLAREFVLLILYGNVWRPVWRICLWILGLKEVMDSLVSNMETCIADSSNNNNNNKIFI